MERMKELANLDLYDEDGFREWTKRIMQLDKDLHNELSFGSGVLYQVLRVTQVSNPRDGAFSGDDAKYYARKVRGYLKRAAQAHEFAARQVAGGWSQFENGFLVPTNTKSRGMTIKSKPTTRSRTRTSR